MAKSSFKQIKEDEKKVLNQLLDDSRRSPNEIANKLKFSRQKVWKIIKKLEKEKKIWGYTAIVNEYDKDKRVHFALIKHKVPYLDNTSQIIKNVKNDNSSKLDIKLLDLYYTNGYYDCICKFAAKDLKDAKKYVGYLSKEYEDCVSEIHLVESVFNIVQSNKINPNLEELRQFSIEN